MSPFESPPALNSIIPTDPTIKSGTLSNGFRYFVLPNSYPKNRIEMRLLVNVGSIFEEEDQRGLAHITEHMAFNGTTNFSSEELIHFLESLGMRYGAHINAATAMDYTLYQLHVPVIDDSTTLKALQVLRDWSSELLFPPEEIERERQVALEEWRMHRVSTQRVMEQIRPLLFAGTPYADRLPIGTEESLKTFSHEALRRFYSDWYRPERMSILVVGDINGDDIVDKIEALFSDVCSQSPSPSLPSLKWERKSGLTVTTTHDPEIPYPAISLMARVPDNMDITHLGYIKMMCARIVSNVCSERLQLLSVLPDAPFYHGSATQYRLHPRYFADSVSAYVPSDGFVTGCMAMLKEVKRIRRYGITQDELRRSIKQIVSSLEVGYRERDSISSDQLIEELQRAALYNEPISGIEYELYMAKTFLSGLTVDDINNSVDAWLPEDGCLLYAIGNNDKQISEDQLIASYQKADVSPISKPDFLEEQKPLMTVKPTSGQIVKRHRYEDFGVEELTLSNGAMVWVMKSELEAESVYMRSYSWGGSSLLKEEEVVPSRFATGVVDLSGLAEHPYSNLLRILSTLQARMSPNCEKICHGFQGGARIDDLESMFQLLYLQTTAPRFEEDAFRRSMNVNQEMLLNRAREPEWLFRRIFHNRWWLDNPRHIRTEAEDFDRMSLEQSQEIYHQLWGQAHSHYIFVGNFNPKELEELICQYIATLPAPLDTKMHRHDGINLIQGSIEQDVFLLDEPKAVVKSKRYIHHPVSQKEDRIRMNIVAMILEQRLRKRLREEQGYIYSIDVGLSENRLPFNHISLRINFGCDPIRVDEVCDEVEQILGTFRVKPITLDEFQTAKHQMLCTVETQDQRNHVWMVRLLSAFQHGESPGYAFKINERIDSVTLQDTMKLLTMVIDSPDHLRMRLLPRKTEGND